MQNMADGPCGVLLLVCGPPACGKTHLVKEIFASDSSRSDSSCSFVSLSFDRLYPSDTRKTSTYSDALTRVSACNTRLSLRITSKITPFVARIKVDQQSSSCSP